MKSSVTTVLLVEDNPGDADLVREMLRNNGGGTFEITLVDRLSSALNSLLEGGFDVVLLDLGLPDSNGLETLTRVLEHDAAVPVVVMTGLDDERVSLDALKGGAQDYLVKGWISPEVVVRSLRYAVDRCRLRRQLEDERANWERERERLAMNALAGPTQVASRLYGRAPLQELSSESFDELTAEYARLLLAALESQIKRTEYCVSEGLRSLADRLGEYRAGPRDVIELHKAALRKAGEHESPRRAQAMTEEGRFLVIELMGHVVSFYRRYYQGQVPTMPNEEDDSHSVSIGGGEGADT